jgi:hypothetical protein
VAAKQQVRGRHSHPFSGEPAGAGPCTSCWDQALIASLTKINFSKLLELTLMVENMRKNGFEAA